MKGEAKYVEGNEAWERFQAAMKRVLAVPHEELQKRIEQHRKEAARNPRKRGPKKQSSASK
jgi:hypothetical protein